LINMKRTNIRSHPGLHNRNRFTGTKLTVFLALCYMAMVCHYFKSTVMMNIC